MDPATRRLLIAIQLCFGVFPLLGKLAMEAFEPRAVLVWRVLVGAGVLLLMAFLRHGRQALPARGDLLRLAGLSVLGVIVNQWLFLEGLHRSTAVNAGLLMAVIPVGTCGLAALLGHERLGLRRQAGVALSVAGVVWLFVVRGAAVSSTTLVGDVLLAVNALSYSFYLVLAKPLLARLPNLVFMAWIFAFGALVVPWIGLQASWVPAGVDTLHWLALAAVLLFPTILAHLGNAVVLSRTRASITATYVMLQPFIAGTLGIVLLGERPEPALALTAVCVLAGLWMISAPETEPASRPT